MSDNVSNTFRCGCCSDMYGDVWHPTLEEVRECYYKSYNMKLKFSAITYHAGFHLDTEFQDNIKATLHEFGESR
jgi:hypothetical protein